MGVQTPGLQRQGIGPAWWAHTASWQNWHLTLPARELKLREAGCPKSQWWTLRADMWLKPLDSPHSTLSAAKCELKQNASEKVKHNSWLHQRMKEPWFCVKTQKTKGDNWGIYFKLYPILPSCLWVGNWVKTESGVRSHLTHPWCGGEESVSKHPAFISSSASPSASLGSWPTAFAPGALLQKHGQSPILRQQK